MILTKENFEEEISKGVMLVDFWAEWCGPCQAAMPILKEFEEKSGVTVWKINVDEQAELAAKFRVMSIPTLVLFKDGEAVEQMVGVQPVEQLVELVEKYK